MTHIIDTLSPTERTFYDLFERREALAERHHRAEAARSSGVAWSGLGPAPFVRSTPDALAEEARAAAAKAVDMGTLYARIAGLQRACLNAHADAEACRAAMNRGDGSMAKMVEAARRAAAEVERAAIELGFAASEMA